jgi:hypothetical protein
MLAEISSYFRNCGYPAGCLSCRPVYCKLSEEAIDIAHLKWRCKILDLNGWQVQYKQFCKEHSLLQVPDRQVTRSWEWDPIG